jgi:Putative sensor
METTLTPRSNPPVILRPLVTARGWTQLTHHLLGLPLGTAYFIWIVTGFSVGAGLAITLVGIPILTFVLANVRPLLMAERGLATRCSAPAYRRSRSLPAVTAGSGV